MCTEHCFSIMEISRKSSNQFLKLYSVKITLEITVNPSKQGFYLILQGWLPSFLHAFLLYLILCSLIFPSSCSPSHCHSDSCITLQLLFGCQIFYSFTVTLIQFRTKSQNAQNSCPSQRPPQHFPLPRILLDPVCLPSYP